MCYMENCYVVRLLSPLIGRSAHFFKGLAYLIPFLVHECLLVLVILSVCVGFTALLSFFHEICWFRPLGADVQAVLALVFLTSLGEGATLVLRKSAIYTYYKRNLAEFPCVFYTILCTLWSVNGLLAMSQLYLAYKDAHPSVYFGNRETDEGIDPATLNSTSTFLVLCSLSFLTYSIPRGTDWMEYRFLLNHADRHRQLGTRIYIAFFCVQILLLALYACPLVVLALFCRFYEVSPLLTFLGLILNGIGLGIMLAQVEDRYCFHIRPMHPPLYAYENHLASRVNLFQYLLIPFAAISYYGSGPISDLSPGDQFLLYTFCLSIALLQAMKCACNNRYLKAIQRLRFERVRQLLEVLVPEPPVILAVAQSQEAVEPAPPPSEVCPEEEKDEEEKNENGNEDFNENLDEGLQDVPAIAATGGSSDEKEDKNEAHPTLDGRNEV